jgi:hypothetical protein
MDPAPQFELPTPPAPPKRFGPGKVLLVVAAAVVVAVLGAAVVWAILHPTVYIVNASSTPELDVFVDGEQVAGGVRLTLREEQARVASAKTNVTTGPHTFTARDAAGNVVDSQTIDIRSGRTYLYAPAHVAEVCWTFETVGYGEIEVDEPYVPLDPAKAFWELPKLPDYRFQETPDTVKVKSSKKGTRKTALRQHACEDSAFTP